MAGEGNVSSQQVGELIAEMRGVKETCLRIEKHFKEEHDKVHSIVDALSDANRVNTLRVADHEERIDVIEVDMAEYRTERDKRKGAAGVWSALYVVLGGLATTGFFKLIDFFSAKPPIPPHP
jgi:23S rRNA U2552 (ribose-2'-O)-methylase RlmE/FtsJ